MSLQGEQIIWASSLTDNDTNAKEKVGTVRLDDSTTYGRRKYLYVQNADATVTISQYDAVARERAGGFKVTSDISDTSVALPGGVALSTINPSRYGWILVAGVANIVNQDGGGDIVTADSLILSSTDGRVDAVAAGTAPTYAIVGVSGEIDAGTYTVGAVHVRCAGAW